MNATVAFKAKADQVIERIICSILIYMMDVNRGRTINSLAYLAGRAIPLPRVPRGFAVAVKQIENTQPRWQMQRGNPGIAQLALSH